MLIIYVPFWLTGETWQQKIWEFEGEESLRGKMAAEGAEAIVVTKLDEIACKYECRMNILLESKAQALTNIIK